MNHETLQALYALDVAEVGEVEAAKRWEYLHLPPFFKPLPSTPEWNYNNSYRRKPGIPWPKVMMQPDAKPEWPADAPEWANYMAIDSSGRNAFFEIKPSVISGSWSGNGKSCLAIVCQNWRDSLIERPKPVLKKIDWSKLSAFVTIWRESATHAESGWIAWNCDQDTRGNPLPDGLVVEWYYKGAIAPSNCPVTIWDDVTRFRIVGIQEGWE